MFRKKRKRKRKRNENGKIRSIKVSTVLQCKEKTDVRTPTERKVEKYCTDGEIVPQFAITVPQFLDANEPPKWPVYQAGSMR